ncbi:MAG: pirin family protein [Bacteroidia bacterium]|nr:pirin family protein [Bacteroidia bacterium]
MRKIRKIQSPRNHIQFIVYPEDREAMKPFVFFDAGNMQREDEGLEIHTHPHSGIGIITYFHGTDLHHGDSGSNEGIIRGGGAQWIRAGGGVWHEEKYRRPAGKSEGKWKASIHQLWMALPPEFEEREVEYSNLQPEEIPSIGQVKVLVGEYQGVKGKIHTPFDMSYLDVSLDAKEEWEIQLPATQSKGFLFPRNGNLFIEGEEIPNQRMGILQEGTGTLSLKAGAEGADFVLLSAAPSQHPLVISRSSIHTNKEALERSMLRIQEIAETVS